MVSKRSIYVSSTFEDLKAHRAALKTALEKAHYNVSCMETYPAFDARPLEKCLVDVAAAEGYVLLVAYRYGYRPKENNPEGKSISELEYEQACRMGKRPLVFTLDPDHPWPRKWNDRGEDEAAVLAFRDRLEQRHGVNRFTEPAQLCSLVLSALRNQEDGAERPPTASRWTDAALEAWVADHRKAVERHFLAIPAVRDRDLHVDLPVALHGAGPRRKVFLRPADLAPALEAPSAHRILLSAEGGAGKTSLAFHIARWGLAGELARSFEGGAPAVAAPLLPVVIDTALAEGETVTLRVRQWLESAIGAARGSLEEELVAELLRRKWLLVIVDHFSELSREARQRVVTTLPTGLVVITSRQLETELLGDGACTRIEPLQIALDQLQRFFHEVLERKGVRQRFSDDDLEPNQRLLRRMVGDKPITPLLALMFIDDVIAKQDGQGVIAASVPELMLGYVNRISEVMPETERRQAGIRIESAWVQRGLMALALASHRQGPPGRPRLQPLSFRLELALEALGAVPGLGERPRREALLAYLLRLRLLHHPGQDRSEYRLALDPLADYLAASRQLELLEQEESGEPRESGAPESGEPRETGAPESGEPRETGAPGTWPPRDVEPSREGGANAGPWDGFLQTREARPPEDLALMRGFLLALRDGCQERMERPRGAAVIPAEVADRLGRLAGLDPREERRRQQAQRARKLIYELAVPEAEDRRRAIEVLAAMGADADSASRSAARQAAGPLAAVAHDHQRDGEERALALEALGRLGGEKAAAALKGVLAAAQEPVVLRRAAAEALGLIDPSPGDPEAHWDLLRELLEDGANHLQGEADRERIQAKLPLLQGASRGLQRLATRSCPFSLPRWGTGPGLAVPMLTLTTAAGAVTTRVVKREVWQLPLPGGIPLEVVAIPEGTYEIGSPAGEEGRDAYGHRPEAKGVEVEPRRSVTVPRFAMARFPLTQAQWKALAGERFPKEPALELDPAVVDPASRKGADLPVETVSWHDARIWCARLQRHLEAELGEAAPRVGLPSESLWEVACRAGSATPFHFGDTLDPAWANYDGNYAYGTGRKGAFLNRTAPVGAYGLVNAWGLADLHGTVWEWCADVWHPSPLAGPTDGRAWEEAAAGLGDNRLLRGGSWFDGPHFCRSACRGSLRPASRGGDVGFRVCCLPPGSLLGP